MSGPRLVADRAAAPEIPWSRIRALVGEDLEGLLQLSDGTASLTIHLEFRGFDLAKASAGGKLAGRRG